MRKALANATWYLSKGQVRVLFEIHIQAGIKFSQKSFNQPFDNEYYVLIHMKHMPTILLRYLEKKKLEN